MQKCFLVSNKVTQVRDYLEHRSIIEVEEEHRNLSELDLTRLGIIDIDKFLYIYYGSDDGDLSFRTDLNIFRQLLSSAFFHTSEAIFILVECQNPMLEDLIKSACRDSNLIGAKLDIIHHTGMLTFSDVSKYVSGSAFGSQTTSSYKAVYIREEDSQERERFVNSADGMDSILPVLTDQYAMYKKRAEVEAVSSARNVTETYIRPQILQNFSKRPTPVIQQWNAFLLTGLEYTEFTRGVGYLLDYYGRVGYRCMVVDVTSTPSIRVDSAGARNYSVGEIQVRNSFSERFGYLKCRYNQLGYVVEMLDNIEGVNTYIFVCERQDYRTLREFLSPLCSNLYCNYVTHFCEEAVQDYLREDVTSTTLFLSQATIYRPFKIQKYRDDFKGTRVASFALDDIDTTDYYECATGGGLV